MLSERDASTEPRLRYFSKPQLSHSARAADAPDQFAQNLSETKFHVSRKDIEITPSRQTTT
jgi:hypothetical protein